MGHIENSNLIHTLTMIASLEGGHGDVNCFNFWGSSHVPGTARARVVRTQHRKSSESRFAVIQDVEEFSKGE